jgi:hypothetical protein
MVVLLLILLILTDSIDDTPIDMFAPDVLVSPPVDTLFSPDINFPM